MEAVIFIGIQAVGKTTFYKDHFFKTHRRISMDMLKTRHRESILVNACIQAKQPFVVDNTNPTIEDRARYITPARAGKLRIVGYYFQSSLGDALKRNEGRSGKEQVPIKGIMGTYKKLQPPSLIEGFDALFYVQMAPSGEFVVEEWSDEV